MTVDIKGYAFNLGGVAVDGASAEVFAKNGGAKVGSTVETGSGSLDDGEFEFSGVAEGTYDIKVTSGTNVRWRKYDDEIQLAALEAGSLRLRGTNAAYTHVFQGTPTATRTITFPDKAGTVAMIADVTAAVAAEDTIAELNDTNISSLAAGHILVYDNTASVWDNVALSGGTGLTATLGDGTLALAIDGTVTTLVGSQVLTNKTLTAPTINGVVGGTQTSATITALTLTSMAGNWTNAGRTVADMGIVTTIDINGGTIDGAVIGGAATAAITGTTVTGSTAIVGGTVAGTTGTFSGVVDITDTTDASDATGDTGALRTEGGASIAQKLYVGTDLDVDGTANLDNTDIDGTLVVDGSNISLDSTATLNIDNSNTSNGISIGTATASVPIAIGHGTSVTTFGDDVIITGDLTINGATTTVASTTLTVVDPLVKYNQGDVNAARDAGFIVTRGNTSATNTANRGFIWDSSEGEFAAIAANTEDGTTSGNVTINDYVDLRVGALTADDASTFTGTVATGALTVTGKVLVSDAANATIPTDGTYFWGDNSGNIHLSALGGVLVDLDTNANGTASLFAVRTNAGTTSLFSVTEAGVVQANSGANGTFQADHNLVLGADSGDANGSSEIRFNVDGAQVAFIGAGGDVVLNAAAKLRLDGSASGDTYIYQESADDLHVVVGDVAMVQLDQDLGAMSLLAAAPAAGQMLRIGQTWAANTGAHGLVVYHTAPYTTNQGSQAIVGVYSSVGLNSTHTANMTAPVAIRGFDADTNIAATSGTITGVAAYYATALVATGATITNEYGLYVNNMSAATNSYGVYVGSGADYAFYAASGDIIGVGKATFGSGAASWLDVSPLNAAADLTFSTGSVATSHMSLINTGNAAINKGASIAMGGSKRTGSFGAAAFAELKAFKENGTDNNQAGYFAINTNSNASTLTERFRIDSAGTAYIGETENANMTVGLTINMGANANEALALKQSNVGHGMTALAELDTYATFSQASNDGGGLHIIGYKDASAANGAIRVKGVLGTAAETDDTSGSQAITLLDASILAASGGGKAAVAATGNAIGFTNNDTMLLIIKGNGTLHATNVTSGSGDLDGVALDGEDDIALIRAHQTHRSQGMGMAMTKWDEAMQANKDDLIRVGVYGSDASLYNMQRMNDLLGGAIWQGHTEHMSLAEKVDGLEVELIEAKKQLAAISA